MPVPFLLVCDPGFLDRARASTPVDKSCLYLRRPHQAYTVEFPLVREIFAGSQPRGVDIVTGLLTGTEINFPRGPSLRDPLIDSFHPSFLRKQVANQPSACHNRQMREAVAVNGRQRFALSTASALHVVRRLPIVNRIRLREHLPPCVPQSID